MTTVASGTVTEVSAIFVERITLQNPSLAGLIANVCSSFGTKECKTQICKASSPTSSSRISTISVIPGTKTKMEECNRASSLIKKTIIPWTALETCGMHRISRNSKNVRNESGKYLRLSLSSTLEVTQRGAY